MSKELWFEAYQERMWELIDSGMSDEEIEAEAIKWAEGSLERAVDDADNLRKARRESG